MGGKVVWEVLSRRGGRGGEGRAGMVVLVMLGECAGIYEEVVVKEDVEWLDD